MTPLKRVTPGKVLDRIEKIRMHYEAKVVEAVAQLDYHGDRERVLIAAGLGHLGSRLGSPAPVQQEELDLLS
jgi:hypothetical protein